MTSKSKGQLSLRTGRRGEQRHQLSEVGDIRDNTTHKRSLSQPKLLHPGSRTNNSLDIGLGQSHMSTSTPIITTGAQQPKAVKMSQNRFITSVSTLQQREQLPSGSLDVTVGVDDSRNDKKRSSSVKGNAAVQGIMLEYLY